MFITVENICALSIVAIVFFVLSKVRNCFVYISIVDDKIESSLCKYSHVRLVCYWSYCIIIAVIWASNLFIARYCMDVHFKAVIYTM